MLRLCSSTLVKMGMAKPCQMVKPVSAALTAGRHLSQKTEMPHLTVPPLQQTCEFYLKVVESLVEGDELRRTKELVADFQKPGGVGEKLQKSLEERASKMDNWLTDYYLRTVYLESRKSLVVFSNSAGLLPKMPFKDKQTQIRYAAKTIAILLDLKAKVENEELPTQYMGRQPLCMEQFQNFFSTCRIPGLKEDSMPSYLKSSNSPKHFIVIHNGQLFALDGYKSDGTQLTVDELTIQLEKICNSSPQVDPEPIGILTCHNRDEWAKAYVELNKDETNRESLSIIQRGIAAICLDGEMPPEPDPTGRRNGVLRVMHGGGSQWNTGNRWFDKGLQAVIGEDGSIGTNGSHLACDGTVAMSVADYVSVNMNKKDPEITQPSTEPLPMPRKLHFNLTPEVKSAIEDAKQHIDRMITSLQVKHVVFKHFGKKALTALKTSPDAFVQMAIQLAYYRIHQHCASQSEPVSLRTFKLGRLSMINANTDATLAFVKAFDDPNKQISEKVDLMTKAVKGHQDICRMATGGQLIEGHLFGLRMQAEEQNIPTPAIFTDTSYDKAFTYKVMTSQVRSQAGVLTSVGPEDMTMYHVFYGIKNDEIDFLVNGWDDGTRPELDAEPLTQALVDALIDMKTLLEKHYKSQTVKSEQ